MPLTRLGLDVIAHAKSGTGKTLVFALTALEVFQTLPATPAALILAPTGELVTQIRSVIASLSIYMQSTPRVVSVIGGVPEREDARRLADAPSILVGTPGRVLALFKHGILCPSAVRLLVMDEADRLLEPAFDNSLPLICELLPASKQCLAFSATFPVKLQRLLKKAMRQPRHVSVCAEPRPRKREDVNRKATLIGVRQKKIYLGVQPSNTREALRLKTAQLTKLLEKTTFTFCMVFTNNKDHGAKLAVHLRKAGFQSSNINAAISQKERAVVMENVSKGVVKVLVSTDLLARGVDIDACDLVVHFDVPSDSPTYLHRVGRTGRFGTIGTSVVLFFSGLEEAAVISIEKMLEFAMHGSDAISDSTVKVKGRRRVVNGRNASVKRNCDKALTTIEKMGKEQLSADAADAMDTTGLEVAFPSSRSDFRLQIQETEIVDANSTKEPDLKSKDTAHSTDAGTNNPMASVDILEAAKTMALRELNEISHEPNLTENNNGGVNDKRMGEENERTGRPDRKESIVGRKRPWSCLKGRVPAVEAKANSAVADDQAWEDYAEKAYKEGYRSYYEISYNMAKQVGKQLGGEQQP